MQFSIGTLDNSSFGSKCPKILSKLFEFLVRMFPKATVLLKFGGDPLLDMARLALANVTICSASTFCLWPAIANNHKAYFPVTDLIGHTGEIARDMLAILSHKHNSIGKSEICD